jgi:hypothetical protein
MTIHAGAELRVSAGSTAVFFGPVTNSAGATGITGTGTKFFEAGGSNLGPLASGGSTIVALPAVVTADSIREASLSIDGLVRINPNGSPAAVSRLGQLSISSGGVFDLTDNDLILDNGDLAAVRLEISSGRLTASSSTPITGLGAIVDSDGAGQPLMTTFDGLPVDSHAVLVKYTYRGDATLDGRVNIDDYFRIDLGFANQVSGGWRTGDFDYSGGAPNGDDYFLIDSAFLQQGVPLGGAPASLSAATAVPEPAIASLLCGLLLPRRRNRACGQVRTSRRR